MQRRAPAFFELKSRLGFTDSCTGGEIGTGHMLVTRRAWEQSAKKRDTHPKMRIPRIDSVYWNTSCFSYPRSAERDDA